jgi:hypothetical protein
VTALPEPRLKPLSEARFGSTASTHPHRQIPTRSPRVMGRDLMGAVVSSPQPPNPSMVRKEQQSDAPSITFQQ